MPGPRLDVVDDPKELAERAARYVADRARASIAARGRSTLAVSGGHTPWAMFAAMREADVPWRSIDVYQVDERVAPSGDPDRNLTNLLAVLPEGPVVHPMPVEDDDLEAAAGRYAATLPDRFDLIHLGLGADGHTASLVAGDPAWTRPIGWSRSRASTWVNGG